MLFHKGIYYPIRWYQGKNNSRKLPNHTNVLYPKNDHAKKRFNSIRNGPDMKSKEKITVFCSTLMNWLAYCIRIQESFIKSGLVIDRKSNNHYVFIIYILWTFVKVRYMNVENWSVIFQVMSSFVIYSPEGI